MCVSGGDSDGENEGNSKSSCHVETLLCFSLVSSRASVFNNARSSVSR